MGGGGSSPHQEARQGLGQGFMSGRGGGRETPFRKALNTPDEIKCELDPQQADQPPTS